MYYRTFTVKNFRLLRNVTISGLGRINLITGRNDVGKTSLLEALFIHCGAHNASLPVRVHAFRGIEGRVTLGAALETPWDWIFSDMKTSEMIDLTAEVSKPGAANRLEERALQLSVSRDMNDLRKAADAIQSIDDVRGDSEPWELASVLDHRILVDRKPVAEFYSTVRKNEIRSTSMGRAIVASQCFFMRDRMQLDLHEFATRFARLQKENRVASVVEALRIVDPWIKDLTPMVIGDKPVICAKLEDGALMPLPLLGGGTARLAEFLITMGYAAQGTILIDEIENGLHHSVLPGIWGAIAKAAEMSDVQVFATTHSLECVRAAYEAFSGGPPYDDFKLFRLDRIDGEVRAIAYDRESLDTAIDLNLEVR